MKTPLLSILLECNGGVFLLSQFMRAAPRVLCFLFITFPNDTHSTSHNTIQKCWMLNYILFMFSIKIF